VINDIENRLPEVPFTMEGAKLELKEPVDTVTDRRIHDRWKRQAQGGSGTPSG
jgi:hypothetical protein